VALYEIVATKRLPGEAGWGTSAAQGEVMDGERTPLPPSRYLHIDGGMADNIRPALYAAPTFPKVRCRPSKGRPHLRSA